MLCGRAACEVRQRAMSAHASCKTTIAMHPKSVLSRRAAARSLKQGSQCRAAVSLLSSKSSQSRLIDKHARELGGLDLRYLEITCSAEPASHRAFNDLSNIDLIMGCGRFAVGSFDS